jgi:hypothetical protein
LLTYKCEWRVNAHRLPRTNAAQSERIAEAPARSVCAGIDRGVGGGGGAVISAADGGWVGWGQGGVMNRKRKNERAEWAALRREEDPLPADVGSLARGPVPPCVCDR